MTYWNINIGKTFRMNLNYLKQETTLYIIIRLTGLFYLTEIFVTRVYIVIISSRK